MRAVPLFLWCLFLGIVAACAFGILFDQISVRNSPAYFTIGHPRRPDWTPDPFTAPTLNAVFWGIFATWWMGAGLGFFHGLWLALVDRRVQLSGLIMRHVYLVLFMGLVGVIGFGFGETIMSALGLSPDQVAPRSMLLQLDNAAQQRAFAVSAMTHSAAYACTGLAAIFLFGYALAHGKRRVV